MLLFCDDRMLAHDPGRHHPESPSRLSAVQSALEQLPNHEWRVPTPASREQVGRVHVSSYVDRVDLLRDRRGSLDPDTVVSTGSVLAAYLAAGAAVDAVSAVVKGEAKHAFALVRPPGHHAEAQAGMGFCLFNNVAVAACHARAALGCKRILIVDWDVHHGNGTQNSFFADDDVLFFSLHQYPFYPGTGDVDETGRDAGDGYTLNVPFEAGRGDADYVTALRDLLVPVADRFAPDLVLVSAGFDAHQEDPLGGMKLTDDGYASMMGIVRDIADRHADGRVVLTLEGGYDLAALASSTRACVEVLSGREAPEFGGPDARGGDVIRAVAAAHRDRWKL
jgi:acetoin utilization deacetylase AcuC-like enzyme